MTVTQRMTQTISAVLTPVSDISGRAVEFWNKINATTFRITITMGVVVMTAMRYQASDITITIWKWSTKFAVWEPSDSWLTFLAVMAGVDALQFAAKRMTHKGEMEQTTTTTTTTPPTPPANP